MALVPRSGAKIHVFDFENDLDGGRNPRGLWRWASKDSIGLSLPSETPDNGFAVMETPGRVTFLTLPVIEYTGAANFTIRFFMTSASEQAGLIVLYEMPGSHGTLLDLKPGVQNNSDAWATVSS